MTPRLVVGIDLGGSHIVGALADLSGTVIQKAHKPTPAAAGPQAVLDALVDVVQGLVQMPQTDRRRVGGIGIGAPGTVHSEAGVVVDAPALGWTHLPLKELLVTRFRLPVFVENDANLIALGEQWFGAARGCENLVCIVIGTGIGAGIIINGQLCRGHSAAAGEIGFVVFDRRFLGTRYAKFGCLETFAAGPGIARRGQEAVTRGEGKGILQFAGTVENISAEHVCEAARRGDATAMRLVRETAEALAVAVANVAAILNPEMVLLGGGVMRSADLLLDPIRACVEAAVPAAPRIVPTQLCGESTVMGAIALAHRAIAPSPAPPEQAQTDHGP